VKRPLLAAALAGLVGIVFNLYVGGALTPLLRLSIGTALLAAVYFGVLVFCMNQKELFGELFRHLLNRAPKTA